MKKLITILFLSASLFSFAQPGGYVAGTQVSWSPNGRPMGYFVPSGWNAATDYTIAFFSGDGETGAGNYQNNVLAKWANDAGTNWNGVINFSGGGSVKVAVISINNTSNYWMPDYAADIATALQAMGVDTSAHSRLFIGGLSGGVGRGFGYLANDQTHNSPYRRCFSVGIWSSGTSVGSTIYNNTSLVKNAIGSGGYTDDGVQHYNDNMITLYNAIPGRKRMDSVVGGGHSSTTWDSFFGVTGTDSNTNKIIWAIQAAAVNMNPTSIAGTDQVLNVPTTSTTLDGSASYDDGSIASYTWSKVFGPSCNITSPSSATTTVTGMLQGVYLFRLSLVDNTGLTSYDELQVVIAPAYTAPSRFYITREVPFQLRGPGDMMVPKNLLDDDTATKYDVGFQSETIYRPFMANFILDSNVTNFRLRAFVGSGGHSASFKFYNNNFTDSAIVDFTNSGNLNWQWVDTTVTKSIAFPIRSFIMTTQTSNNDFRDFEFYGNISGATVTEYWPNYTGVPKTTVADNMMLGINGDEPATLIAKWTKQAINGTKVWYYDTAIAGITPSTHKFHFNVFGNNVLGDYQAYTSQGIKMYTYTLGASAANFYTGPKAPYTGGGSPYDYYSVKAGDTRNILPGSDSLNPASYIADAKLAATFATFFGANPTASTAGLTATFSGGATAVVGPGNAARALSMKNEQDADWDSIGRARYTEPQAVIASLSAAYDSAYVRDSTFEIWDGALARPHVDVIKAKAYWSYRYRGFNRYPAKAISINWYATLAGGQGGTSTGASPEYDRTMYRVSEWVAVKNKYVGSPKFVIQEFGWDAAPSSGYAAATIGAKSRREVAADWAIRYWLLARAGGADKTTIFRSLDLTNNLNDGGSFITSGLSTGWKGVNPDSSYATWPLGYAMATLLNNTEKYIGKPDTLRNGGTTSYYIFKDSAITGHDTTCYYTWMGTSNGSSQSVTINAPSGKTFSSVTVVTPRYTDGTSLLNTGSLTGVRTTLVAGSSFTVTATETPIMILVKEVSTGTGPVIRSRKFRRIR